MFGFMETFYRDQYILFQKILFLSMKYQLFYYQLRMIEDSDSSDEIDYDDEVNHIVRSR
jgi:hypothetical protein